MSEQLMQHLAVSGAEELYPRHVEARFPHVVKRIAEAWQSPPKALAIFDELLIDRRGSRQGFPPESALELLRLSTKYQELTSGWRGANVNFWHDSIARPLRLSLR